MDKQYNPASHTAMPVKLQYFQNQVYDKVAGEGDPPMALDKTWHLQLILNLIALVITESLTIAVTVESHTVALELFIVTIKSLTVFISCDHVFIVHHSVSCFQ